MNSSQYRKSQLKMLSSVIGCKPEQIEYITENIDHYYDEWIERKKDKKTGDFKKYKDGTIKERAIRPSLDQLKEIQTRIKDKILSNVPLPINIHGGVKKKNNITNGKAHQGNKFQFATDLQEFYPSITHKHVYSAFLSLGYSNHIANWLTKLTTWKFELPQGAPTSTHIANLVFLKTDKLIISFCEKHNLTYTRYVDDLTFSSNHDFRTLTLEIIEIIKQSGFKISYRKTKYKGNQTITGINVFNNFIDAPLKIKQKAEKEQATEERLKPYLTYLGTIRNTNKNISVSKKKSLQN